MYVPLWAVATVLYVVALIWACRSEGDYDFSPPIYFLLLTCCYLLFWVAYLALT